MKTSRMIIISSFALVFFFTSSVRAQGVNISANVSFNSFYSALSPYGQWIDMPRYGKVWLYKEAGFRPYATRGYWQETDMGNSWVSEYPWGWAPFHYGRWELDPYYGWIWIPGYDYAPAWVTWSQADGYYGWAPLGFGIDIHVSIGRIPYDRWMYAPRANLFRPGIYSYCVPHNRVSYYHGRQRPNVVVYSTPRRNNPGFDRRYDRGNYNNRNDNRNNNRYDNRDYGYNRPRNDNRDNIDRGDRNNSGNVPPPVQRPATGSRPDRPYSRPENYNNNRNDNNRNDGPVRPVPNNNRSNQSQRMERVPITPNTSREIRSNPRSNSNNNENRSQTPSARSRSMNMQRG